MRDSIQRLGGYLSGMVLPSISAFIAWGLLTAFVIPTGWTPNDDLLTMVGPIILYLLPLLIGYNGGKLVHGHRGGVVGATVTMGVIVGATIPMFLGAMIVGPLGGYAIKKIDEFFDGKVKQGFEMLVSNFSAGIASLLLLILSFYVIGPVVNNVSDAIGSVVGAIVDANMLFFVSILVEPAKVLFLNNAINHGVFGPLGAAEALETGKSIFFMIETNPGPGLGILLAYWFFGKGVAKGSAPGAIIIHFFGGIHEIYFPYILMKPRLILAAIAGGMAGVATNSILGNGLVAGPSPGSIFAYIAVTPKGGFIGMFLAIIISTAVAFVVAAALLKTDRSEDEDLEAATGEMEALKGKKSQASAVVLRSTDVNLIVFACDAGMGSSAMGASLLKDKVKKAGIDVKVTNTALKDIPAEADVVVTHKSLVSQAEKYAPQARIIAVENFLSSPEYDKLIDSL